MLCELVRAAGAIPVDLGIARDDEAVLEARLLAAAAEHDAIVTSGGVSVGDYDVVKAVLDRIGVLRWSQIAIKPAKPFAFGVIGTTPILGLPGNPVSSFVTFECFVRPVIRRLAGRTGNGRTTVRARLTEPVTKSAGRRAYLRVRLAPGTPDAPEPRATLAGGQGSHVLSALARADGLAIIPHDVDGLPSGSLVDVIRIAEEAAP